MLYMYPDRFCKYAEEAEKIKKPGIFDRFGKLIGLKFDDEAGAEGTNAVQASSAKPAEQTAKKAAPKAGAETAAETATKQIDLPLATVGANGEKGLIIGIKGRPYFTGGLIGAGSSLAAVALAHHLFSKDPEPARMPAYSSTPQPVAALPPAAYPQRFQNSNV